ncbi:MAG: DUF3971 domain-containing protein [Pseudomonadota bacterium]
MVGLRQRIAKVALVGLAACVVVGAVLAVVAYWRLSQGPVSLSFLSDKIRSTISQGLGGLPVEIADIVIERDTKTGRTSVRARDLRLFDASGSLIAKAPRATIELKGGELLKGKVVPIGLRLIGPNIRVRRMESGEIRLGFGDAGYGLRGSVDSVTGKGDALAPAGQVISQSSGKSDVQGSQTLEDNTGLIDFIKAEFLSDTGDSAAATIRSISISQAAVSLYDETNKAIWNAPEVNLAFKKVAFGASLFVDGLIASSGAPWRVDMVANYRRQSGDYSLTARFHDLIPANLSRQVFVLSKLTRVRLPLSGRLDVELDPDGGIKTASAELSAAAGRLGFPDVLSQPVRVDEGLLRLNWEPETRSIKVRDSVIVASGAQSALNGRISPHWTKNGQVDTVSFDLKTRTAPVAEKVFGSVDRVDVKGTAYLDRGQVDVEDLLIMSGKAGMRMRGSFADGGQAMSIKLAGRIHQMPVQMLRNIWSPIVAPSAREWVAGNIPKGRLTGGTFVIDIPGEMLAATLEKQIPLPDSAVQVDADFAGVTSNYFEGQPPFENLSGKILITGDRMALASLNGVIRDAAGHRVQVVKGRMDITRLAAPISNGDFRVSLKGSLKSFFDLADRKPLRFLSEAGFDPKGASGGVAMDLRVRLPLTSDRPEGATKVSANVQLSDLTVKNAARELDLTDGRLKMAISNDGVKGSGPIKLAGIPATLEWSRRIKPTSLQSLTLKTTLSATQRQALGIDISKFITGPIKFTLQGSSRKGDIEKINISADMSRTQIRFDAIQWRHIGAAGTSAAFDADFSDPKLIQISNLNMKGKGFLTRGKMTLAANGEMLSAELPTVHLGANNRFGIRMKRETGGKLVLDIDGQTFDARPMIASLFDESTGRFTPSDGQSVDVRARFNSVYAYRNQHLVNVRTVASARGQALQSMRLSGIFADRTPLDIVIEPQNDGSRIMSVTSRNAGAALRASNLYSKVQGGNLQFTANLGRPGEGTIRRGDLSVHRFVVADEQQLAQFRRDPNANRASEPLVFDKLTLPFAVDREFVRIGDARVQGQAVGALAKGSIRKADGRLSIGGTLIPAYGLNSALSNFPLLGLLIAGGKDEGVIGLTFGLEGTMKRPELKINPVSALAPGLLRKMFEFSGRGALDQKKPRKLGRESVEENR